MLEKIRTNFTFFGSISILFGILTACCFYKAGFGISFLIFTAGISALLLVSLHRLTGTLKRYTFFCCLANVLLAASTLFTANSFLRFLTITGILILFDLALVHQLNEDFGYTFFQFLGHIIRLPFGAIAAIGYPFVDLFRFTSRTRLFKNDTFRNILFGLIAAIPILGVVLLLLTNADQIFNRLAGGLIRNFVFSSDPFFCFLLILAGFVFCYAVLCAAGTIPQPASEISDSKSQKLNPVFLSTILSCITLVYLLFCGIQILYLFAGGLFTLPEEFTYSEYARKGFFELLFVAVINFLILLVCVSRAERTKLIRILLTVMSGCTFIMIASAAYRMGLYVASYHLTMLRLLVLFFLGILTILMSCATAAVYREQFPLFFCTAAVLAGGLFVLNLARPDALIARYNISAVAEYTDDDVHYLLTLSEDAAPEVFSLLKEHPELFEQYPYLMDRVNHSYVPDIEEAYEERGIRGFHFSYYWAYQALEEYLRPSFMN
ncbi:MAG: DUF4173 domain-containing protein [Lachnospiraceae bacterium]|nr:DUF4173 domain-containing protein [Lachnospiraceae bacterium]